MSWSRAGNQLVTCAKDKQVRILDPRANIVSSSAIGHENGKDSRVVWLGDSNFIITSGFDSVIISYISVSDTSNHFAFAFDQFCVSLMFTESNATVICVGYTCF